MTQPAAADPPPIGLQDPRRSLSFSLLGLTVVIVLVAAILVFVPGLVRERRDWLTERLTQAHVAALSVAAAPGGNVDFATREELLRLSGAVAIRVSEPGRGELALRDAHAAPAAHDDLRLEDRLTAMSRALGALIRSDDRLIQVTGPSRFRPGAVVDLLMRESVLHADLRDYAWQSAEVAVAIAVVTGAIVYLALLRLLVRPMRRLTRSIAAFRADPEHTAPIGRSRAAPFGEDEMAAAERELAALQSDLRAALWRNARLAALGTAMAQVSHDLRGILSPALLVADTLREHSDPAIRRAGDMVVRVVDRATNLARSMLDFAREGPNPPDRARVDLRALADEMIQSLGETGLECAIVNDVPPALLAHADHDQSLRVLTNLACNACEAGARRVRVSASLLEAREDGTRLVGLDVEDDGPGLPDRVRATLFRPFTSSSKPGGSGLGLAIARDLARAQGGELQLLRTGPAGAAFRLSLPAAADELVGA